MPHTDGPLFHSVISTISLGSHTILEFYRRNVVDSYDDDTSSSSEPALFNPKDCTHKLLLEPRSLLILKDDLYSEYLHSISEVEEDILCDKIVNFSNCENTYKLGDKLKRKTRVSMTIRHVPKTTKLKLKF
uniref:Fe2OG dioxygenase domain-containing protein n=1 Tax=Megaselia scalaris TaxID=36166 RepID=T1GDS9_MEGSC